MAINEEILLGKIGLSLGIISKEQLEECLREQEDAQRQVKKQKALLIGAVAQYRAARQRTAGAASPVRIKMTSTAPS